MRDEKDGDDEKDNDEKDNNEKAVVDVECQCNVGKMLKGNNDAVETSPSDGIEDKMKSFTIMFIIRTVHAMYVRI